MTEEELLKIKEHIEIHSRKEPPARKITEILWKAVGELEHISEIKEQLEAAKQERNEIEKFKADYKKLCNLKNMRIAELENEKCELLGIIQGKDEAIKNLTQNLEDTEIINKTLGERCNQLLADKGKLTDENMELKVRIGLSIECGKARKNGELCLGYGGDEDEPCERCKNCIKCECGYYQLGETEKDEQLIKAKEIIKELARVAYADYTDGDYSNELSKVLEQAEQFLNSEVEK